MRAGGSWRRLVAGSVVGVVVLAGVALAVVHGVDQAALSDVQVFLDGRSLTCTDPADVTTVASGSTAVPAVRDAQGVDCTLSLVVRNGSGREVGVQRVIFAGFGPESRSGLHTDYSFTQGLSPYPGGDRRDVVFDYVHDPRSRAPYFVDAGTDDRLRFHLTGGGCEGTGDSVVWTGTPVVVVAAGVATRSVGLSGAGLGVEGTAAEACR